MNRRPAALLGTGTHRTSWTPARAAIIGAIALTQASPALGYCRSTTCSSDTDDYCAVGDNGCIIDGLPLSWPMASTLDFVLDVESAEEAGVEDAPRALEDAVAAWSAVRCDDSPPEISLSVVAPEESPDGAGTIEIEFVSFAWPYEENAVGRTVIEFDEETGWVAGATIYLNSEQYVLAEDPRDLEIDLTAVLTHEIGHVLALGHTTAAEATMQSEATSGFTSELRSLESDDEAGICALYPPESETVEFDLGEGGSKVTPTDDEEPTGGGCSQAPRGPTGTGWAAALLFLAGAVGLRKRLRAVPQSSS